MLEFRFDIHTVRGQDGRDRTHTHTCSQMHGKNTNGLTHKTMREMK